MSTRPSESRRAARRSLRPADGVAAGLLFLVVAGAFSWTQHLGPGSSWETPLQFSGDALVTMAGLWSAGEPQAGPLALHSEHRLGAPGGARWADFPGTDDGWLWLGGQLARGGGLGLALNLLYLLAAVLAAGAMFACARSLGAHPALAAASGALYGLSPYLYTRNEQHLGLTLYGLLPLGLLLWRRLARRGGWTRPVARWLPVGAALMGAQSVYYVAYFLAGLALVVGLHVWRRRWRAALWTGGCAAATVAVAGLLSADSFALWAQEGRNPRAVVRAANEAAIVGLWPEQLVIPSDFHRFGWVREAVAPYSRQVGRRGEYPSAYLGAVGAVSLAWILVAGARRVRRRAFKDPDARTAGFVLFWLALSLPVGLFALVGRVTGAPLLRSNNRVSIVLLAIALSWLAVKVSRWARRLPAWVPWAAASALTLAGLVEQTPLTEPDVDPRYRPALEADWTSSARFVERLEGQGSAPLVFVYPPAAFPEDPAPPFGDPYLPLQLYVHSQRSRFSFGGVRGRASGDWPARVAGLDDAAFAAELDRAGFTALVTHAAACPAGPCRERLERLVAGRKDLEAFEGGASGWLGWRWSRVDSR